MKKLNFNNTIAKLKKDYELNKRKFPVKRRGVKTAEKPFLNSANYLKNYKTKPAKLILDGGWGQFLDILRLKAEKAGVLTVEVNPNGTSQYCSNCGHQVSKELKDRIHGCDNCGIVLCRDVNAAINIKHLAVGIPVNKAYRVSEAIAGVGKKPPLVG